MKYLVVFATRRPYMGALSGTLFGVESFDTLEDASAFIKRCAPSENGGYIIVPFYEPDKLS